MHLSATFTMNLLTSDRDFDEEHMGFDEIAQSLFVVFLFVQNFRGGLKVQIRYFYRFRVFQNLLNLFFEKKKSYRILSQIISLASFSHICING